MGTISGGNQSPQYIPAGRLGQFQGRLGAKVNATDTNQDGNLNVKEIKAAADSNQDNEVSEAEAQAFVDSLRNAATPQEGEAVARTRRGGDSISEDALVKIKEAAMNPLDENIEFTFSRLRYASVFCTRF